MSEYSEQIKNMKWSFSRVSTFESCKYNFFLQYILPREVRKEIYPPESNFWAENGSLVHDVLEKVFKGEISIGDANSYYIEHYDEIENKVKPATMNKTFEKCSDYLAEVDFSWLEHYEILGVEMKVDYELFGYKFLGFIDLLLKRKDNGKIILMDHKSSDYFFKKNGEVKANMKEKLESYKKQMYMYSNAVKEKFGVFPDVICWNHFKDGGKFSTIPFKQEEYEETMRWFLDSVHEIEQEEIFEPVDPEQNYFFCNNLCSFRNSCEYVCEVKNKRKYSKGR